jgi:DNA-binding response OmpR family regulator
LSRKVLVVEDDKEVAEMIASALKSEDMDVAVVSSDNEAINLLNREKFDVVIVEDNLKSGGKEFLRKLRTLRDHATVPVVFVGKGSDIDRIIALEMGADDYLERPFNSKELSSRVKAILRRIEWDTRKNNESPPKLKFKDLEIDKESYEVKVRGKSVHLTPLEFDLLKFLAENEGKVFSRETLLGRLWGYDYFVDTRTVDVHIRRLRTKIEEDPSNPRYIITVRGKGYKFVDPGKEGEGDTL